MILIGFTGRDRGDRMPKGDIRGRRGFRAGRGDRGKGTGRPGGDHTQYNQQKTPVVGQNRQTEATSTQQQHLNSKWGWFISRTHPPNAKVTGLDTLLDRVKSTSTAAKISTFQTAWRSEYEFRMLLHTGSIFLAMQWACPKTICKVNGVEVKALADTGSEVRTITKSLYEQHFSSKIEDTTH